MNFAYAETDLNNRAFSPTNIITTNVKLNQIRNCHSSDVTGKENEPKDESNEFTGRMNTTLRTMLHRLIRLKGN
ncbi:hypothetical protein EB796_017076 [Bugula neritina]|uniref:Uncharacterized protein n=1 Tax=Bugula neritina TaxID=10212 RepID=A0A7J7JE94_BUGNE|nr:hypothetical protein EB796_017076 [Bugula neritina]